MFETDDGRTFFATTLFIHPDFIPSNGEIKGEINEGINEGINCDLTESEELVLETLRINNTLSIPKISERSNLTRSSVERALKGLKEKEIIVREGARKNGFWVILGK